MAAIAIVLRKEIKQDGTSPLAIRITKDRKSSYIYLEYSIQEKDWDRQAQRVRKSHPNSSRLNSYLLKKKAEADERSLELETTKTVVSAKAVSQKLKPKAGDTVFVQADLYINRLKEDGKFNRWNSEKSNVKHLKGFLKTDIPFQDLTESVLKRFKAHLISKNKVTERTAINNWITVRSIFSQAIKEGACDPKYYPFGKGKLTIKFPDSKKIGLNAEDVTRIEAAEISRPEVNHARNLWLISFYFAGMRISDVLRLCWSDFQDGRMYYTMGKNNKGDSLKVPEKVVAILKQYEDIKQEDTDLIFAELRRIKPNDRFEMERAISSRINSIDRFLRDDVRKAANITKPLTMHIARHTFGNISGDRIPVQMLQKLYRHTDIKTTIGYQANFIHGDVDEALDAVISPKL
ncbi:site-specific integrase [Taibaiella koreensis]|uniref:site-specific integrase n=1 Tax=Taibaiella koreensis TaxID=1268548 RepID=UPI000E59C68C|nr:site-specific integrase [Taibaiella koreensis]